jgi:hypothetical protein
VGPDLRELALLIVRELLVQLLRDRKPEHAVPEELEPFVGSSALPGPGGMREGSLEALGGERVDEGEEAGVRVPLRRCATGAS